MQESTSREKVLKKIRTALLHHNDKPYPGIDWDKNLYKVSSDSHEEMFAKSFTKIGGQFFFCENELEFLENLISLAEEKKWKKFFCWDKKITKIMDDAEFPYTGDDKNFDEGMVGITFCESLVARLGSIMVSSKQASGRRLVVVPTTHIVLAYTSQIVVELKDAFTLIKNKYGEQLPSMITNIAGPSRTADIEKTLVTGAHGPKEIFVFLVDDSSRQY